MALTITVDVSDDDQTVLEYLLLDIDEWVQAAVRGKVNNCRSRMSEDAQNVLIRDPAVTTMPATEDGLLAAYKARPDYRDRRQREAEEAQRREIANAAQEALRRNVEERLANRRP